MMQPDLSEWLPIILARLDMGKRQGAIEVLQAIHRAGFDAGFDAAIKLLRDSAMISSNPIDIAVRRDAADYLEANRPKEPS